VIIREQRKGPDATVSDDAHGDLTPDLREPSESDRASRLVWRTRQSP
jgi:hypothetical protein